MPVQRPYTVTEEEKLRYAGVYLLWRMINDKETFPVYLEDDNQFLDALFLELLTKDYAEISDDNLYVATEAGRAVAVRFMERYTEYLKIYDVYHSVDLEVGEFAMASYFDYVDRQPAYQSFLSDERWEDLRVAVAEYKDMNPVEIVVMSSINENRFGKDSDTGWQFDLLLGSVWDAILEVCNTNLSWEDLGPEDVIQDIITQGTELTLSLLREEERRIQEAGPDEDEDDDDDEDEVETVYVDEIVPVVEYDYYYTHYSNPFYCSPFWYDPWYW